MGPTTLPFSTLAVTSLEGLFDTPSSTDLEACGSIFVLLNISILAKDIRVVNLYSRCYY